uniref:RNA-directed RNA polymerase n=1 Tax=Riboviria sp. TaxID=2585031 RepID=A0A8K1U2A9_9VIRU|nr:MAG: hypothetical protein 1 [Riboviria sp.]
MVRNNAAAKWELPEDFLERSHFLRVVDELDKNSSPGYPYLLGAPNNGIMLGWNGETYAEEKVERLWQMVVARMNQLEAGKVESDPIRLFIKQEPHKQKKLETEMYRLISSVSLVDQVIDHMLDDSMNQAMIMNWDKVPSKGGWSPFSNGWMLFSSRPNLSLDKRGWDWSARYYLVGLVYEVRRRLCLTRGPLFERWQHLTIMRYKCLYEQATFVTTGGILLQQLEPGVVKSGSVKTFSDNSLMQEALHVLASYRVGIEPGFIYTCGDDTNQEDMCDEDLNDYLEELGQLCHIKSWVRGNEFGGMRFKGSVVDPLYHGKHAFNLLHMKRDCEKETMDSYVLLYHRSPFRDYFRKMAGAMGLDVFMFEECDDIFDGRC